MGRTARRVTGGKKNVVEIEGRRLELSNLDKVLYPSGFTKGQVIDYYTRIAPFILPHLKDRPMTLKRFPDGVRSEHFYEKNAPSFTPDWVKTFPIPRESRGTMINYILINDLPTLVWSANLANLEMHPFLSRVPDIDVPTMVVFDLDPGAGANILNSCEAAFLVKDLLERLQLKSFVKVSGSKGIHLHVPLNTRITYETTQPFARSIAESLENEHPASIVSEMAIAKRKGKVFIDWSQNSRYKSTVAVYSLRAKHDRPYVAMPVTWRELASALKKKDPSALFFEPEQALKRAKKSGDLFAPVATLKQTLPKPFLDLGNGAPAETSPSAAHALETYRQKRDFTKTPEPPPSIPQPSRQGGRRLYVIQKHAASHLHYDLRLEIGGTLKSWAVPKGPPLEPGEKRLAMATEDHPMDYARFEGIIPKGEYGGGTVMVWDIGTYELIDGNYWKGKLHIFIDGKKLKGEWVLTRKDDHDGKRNAWLMIKVGDSRKRLPEGKENASALTGRSMEEIAAAKDAVWHSNRNGGAKAAAAGHQTAVDLESLPRARLGFIEPMYAKPVAELPDDPDKWLYEVKLDGYRCLALKDKNRVTLFSRRGNALNDDFPTIAEGLMDLEDGTMIDGEIVALDKDGRPSFHALQNYRSGKRSLHYYVFDLLSYRGKSLLRVELRDRRELLRAVLPVSRQVNFSENFPTSAARLLRSAKELRLEGIVAKRVESFYEPGKRSDAWVKYKIQQSQEFVVGGYKIGNPLESLLVGYYDADGKLVFLDKVRNGLTPWLRKELHRKLAPLETDVCPFANLPERKTRPGAVTKEEMKKCRWVRPALVAQIEFGEWTADGHLRHPKFVALREDKDPREVVRE
ncbi:MAG: non-homologous end-joining DNA ligase [Candidatus Binatia bacterium]